MAHEERVGGVRREVVAPQLLDKDVGRDGVSYLEYKGALRDPSARTAMSSGRDR